jgi:selenocysteine-specific elongation factor
LTGTDPDRLSEEKRRGISIDIGFAHLTLAGNIEISFVDVPGHERFVKNMLAGAAGIEAVVLVVAADESVMPQTREHFEICRLLDVKRGIVALTKCDAATAEQMARAESDVRRLCGRSFLARAPIVRTSSATGAGLEELKRELAQISLGGFSRTRRSEIVRLPIDRSFALKGFGTVVTGTLWSGTLHVGDTVELLPHKQQVRIRGLQVHGKAVESATPGQRTAANLSGIDHTAIERGCVLIQPGALEPARLVDTEIEWLDQAASPGRREQFLLHMGTSEAAAHLKVLETLDGGRTLARIWSDAPVVAAPGDRFVLRRPSPSSTVAGGTVIDISGPKRQSRAKLVSRVGALQHADLAGRIEYLVHEHRLGRRIEELARMTGMSKEQVTGAVKTNRNLHLTLNAERVLTTAWIANQRERVVAFLRAFHAKYPSAAGAPVAAARLGLDSTLAAAVFSDFPAIRIQGDTIALANHRAEFTPKQAEALQRIELSFRHGGFTPPPVPEALKSAGAMDSKQTQDLLETLVKKQRLVRVSNDLIFHADVIAHIRQSLAAHRGRRFSVPEFKEWTHISRKYAIPLLEYLDHQHVTRREGDMRVVL